MSLNDLIIYIDRTAQDHASCVRCSVGVLEVDVRISRPAECYKVVGIELELCRISLARLQVTVVDRSEILLTVTLRLAVNIAADTVLLVDRCLTVGIAHYIMSDIVLVIVSKGCLDLRVAAEEVKSVFQGLYRNRERILHSGEYMLCSNGHGLVRVL